MGIHVDDGLIRMYTDNVYEEYRISNPFIMAILICMVGLIKDNNMKVYTRTVIQIFINKLKNV
jgi:hypothetical protein